MEIIKYSDDFIKVFSAGIEKDYRGTSIVYENMTKTLIYYYYPNHKRLYVVDGKREDWGLPQVIERVRKIAVFYDRQVRLFNRYMRSILKNKSIFYLCDSFFYDLDILLKNSKTKFIDIMILYNKYTGEKNADNDDR